MGMKKIISYSFGFAICFLLLVFSKDTWASTCPSGSSPWQETFESSTVCNDKIQSTADWGFTNPGYLQLAPYYYYRLGPDVDTDTSGNTTVAWSDQSAISDPLSAVDYPKAQKLSSAAGAKSWASDVTITDGGNADQGDVPVSVAVDSSNNNYFYTRDAFWGRGYALQKYNSSGVIQWTRSAYLEGPDDSFGYGNLITFWINQAPLAVDTDSSNNVYIAYLAWRSDDTDDDGLYDKHYEWIYLKKYDSGGTLQWTKTIAIIDGVSIETGLHNWALGEVHLKVEPSGTIYLANMERADPTSSSSDWNLYVRKYNSSGTLLDGPVFVGTLKQRSDIRYPYGFEIASNNSGTVYLAWEGEDDNVKIRRVYSSGSQSLGSELTIASGFHPTIDLYSSTGDIYVGYISGFQSTASLKLVKYNSSESLVWGPTELTNANSGFISFFYPTRNHSLALSGSSPVVSWTQNVKPYSEFNWKPVLDNNIYVAKIDSTNGSVLWTKQANSNPTSYKTSYPLYAYSKTFDTGFSSIVTYSFQKTENKPSGTSITYEFRDSADGSGWSAWTGNISTLSRRYVQFRITLSTTNTNSTPTVDQMTISFSSPSDLSFDVANSEFQFYEDAARTVVKSAFTAGQRIYVRVRIQNTGDAINTPGFWMAFYRDRTAQPPCNQTPDPDPGTLSPPYESERQVDSLGAGAWYTWDFQVPAPSTGGPKLAYVFADYTPCPNGAIAETGVNGETNNIKSRTYTVDVNAWFQSADGDVGSGGTISLGATKTVSTFLLGAKILDNAEGTWKLDNYGDNDNERLISAPVYDYMAERFRQKAQEEGSQVCNIPAGLPQGDYYYYCLGNAQFHVGNGPNGNNVFFIDGNLTVDGNLTLNSSDSSVFVVKGDITVNTNVTEIDGIYIAGGGFRDTTDDSHLTGNTLDVYGSIYAQTVNLNRILTSGNESTPAERIYYQPKYIVAVNSLLGSPAISWKEVAP